MTTVQVLELAPHEQQLGLPTLAWKVPQDMRAMPEKGIDCRREDTQQGFNAIKPSIQLSFSLEWVGIDLCRLQL